MKKIIAGAILSLIASVAMAGEFDIGYPVAAYHIGGQTNYLGHPYNDSQYKYPGFSLEYKADVKGDFYAGVEVGSYENSWFNRSNFAVVDGGAHIGKHIDIGVDVGTINGYGADPKKYGPALTPYVTVKEGHLFATVNFIPTTIKQGHNALGFSVGLRF